MWNEWRNFDSQKISVVFNEGKSRIDDKSFPRGKRSVNIILEFYDDDGFNNIFRQ